MDFWLFEIFNSFDEKNKDILLTLFLSIAISLITYAIPAGWGKLDLAASRFALAKLTNDAFPRAIVGGISFYIALNFLVRAAATDSLFRGMYILIGITVLCWLSSLYISSRNQKTIEKKEKEYLEKRDKKLPVEFSVWRMIKWNLFVVFVWLTISVGFCLSKPLNDALVRSIPKQFQPQKSQD